jgi:hypothetical protein
MAELLRALAQWVAGELFRHAANLSATAVECTPTQAQPHIAPTEAQLKAHFPHLSHVLLSEGLTTKKALTEFPKWAAQNADARLADDAMAALGETLRAAEFKTPLLTLLDDWMEQRSPKWFFGFRNITNATNERTFIGTVIPRFAVGHSMPLMFFDGSVGKTAALIGSFSSLVMDYVARQKVGGTNMTYGFIKQFPVLPPDQYTPADLAFIVPRVLELTYTAHDLQAWGHDLTAYDPRPTAEKGRPFAWNPERRAQLRAELDAYYARLYRLTRDELRYILDPKEVMGADYPSETFRVLKEGEMRNLGEYRTRRLVLEAWDRLSASSWQETRTAPMHGVEYSPLGLIRSAAEATLAGLVVAILEERPEGSSLAQLQSLVARAATSTQHLDPTEAAALARIDKAVPVTCAADHVERVLPIVQRLEAAGVAARRATYGESLYVRGAADLPGDVNQVPEHREAARLLVMAEARRIAAERSAAPGGSSTSRNTGTG